MRLLSLRLHSPFRGLPADFHVDFRQGQTLTYEQLEPVCFVGLNGSGKSNVLQVIAEIFAYLEIEYLRQGYATYPHQLSEDTACLDFTLEYALDELNWNLAKSNDKSLPEYNGDEAFNPVIRIQKYVLDSFFKWGILLNNTLVKQLNREGFPPLPQHVVGYSSGMNELISNPFIRLDVSYAEQLLKQTETAELAEEFRKSESPFISELVVESVSRKRMVYLDYESNKLITLANFLISDGKQLQLLYEIACIENLHSFSVTINYPYHLDSEGEPLYPIRLPAILNETINKLTLCATTWEGEPPEVEYPVRLQLDFWVNDATKAAFNYHFRTANNLLNAFYGLRLLNVLGYSLELRDRIKQSSPDDNLSVLLPRPEPQNAPFHIGNLKLVKYGSRLPIAYRNLSDGEHQLLHVFGALMLVEQPGTLFLFDEPETHFNPEWRSQFVQLMNQITQDFELNRKREQEVLLTSHSPFIVSDCKPENVFVFKRNQDGIVTYRRAADHNFSKAGAFNTFGASERTILQEVFGYRKSISELVNEKIRQIKETATSVEKIQDGRKQLLEFGESFEKFDALNYLDIKEDELSSEQSA